MRCARSPAGASLVITDTNRRRGRLTSFLNTYGPTLQAGEQPFVTDPYNQPFDVFPDATSKSQTVTVMSGVKNVQATSGTQPFSLMVNRPSLAVDGNVKTAWLVDGSVPVGPEMLRITFDKADHHRPRHARAAAGPGAGPVDHARDVGVRRPRCGAHPARQLVAPRVGPDRAVPPPDVLDARHPHRRRPRRGQALPPERGRLRGGSGGRRRVGRRGRARAREHAAARRPARRARPRLERPRARVRDVARRDGRRGDATPVHACRRPATFTLSGTAQLGTDSTDGTLDRRLGLADASAGGISITSSRRLNDPIARGLVGDRRRPRDGVEHPARRRARARSGSRSRARSRSTTSGSTSSTTAATRCRPGCGSPRTTARRR